MIVKLNENEYRVLKRVLREASLLESSNQGILGELEDSTPGITDTFVDFLGYLGDHRDEVDDFQGMKKLWKRYLRRNGKSRDMNDVIDIIYDRCLN